MAQVSKIRKVRKTIRDAAHNRRSKEIKAKKRSRIPACNAFLKQQFLPVTDRRLPDNHSIAGILSTFERSFAHLGELYRFVPVDLYETAFPLNIHHALKHAETYIEKNDKSSHLLVMQDEDEQMRVVTAKSLQASYDLYYVQAAPLYRLLADTSKRPFANLLLSMFAYLYQVANMPFCNEQFIGGTYDMIEEWIADDPDAWDEEDYAERLDDITQMNKDAKRMCRIIADRKHLRRFERRITTMLPENETEAETVRLAVRFFQLWKEYPGHGFNSNVFPNLLNPEMEERMYVEQYFSFVWESRGWLFEDLMENINVSLQEYSTSDDPVAVQFFETPQDTIRLDLPYENLLLKLIEELIDILNTL